MNKINRPEMKPDVKNEIIQECERMANLYFKGKRIYTDDYIIRSLSFRYGITQSKIKDLLNEIPKQQKPQEQPRNKTRFCNCCGADITHKQRNAIFCNSRCKGKFYNIRKKQINENTKKPK